MLSFMRVHRRPLEILCEDHVGTYVVPFLADGVMAYGEA